MKQEFMIEGPLEGEEREILSAIERAIIESRVQPCKWRTEMIVTYYDDGLHAPAKGFSHTNRLIQRALANEGVSERTYIAASVFIGRSRPHVLVELEDMR